MQWLERIKCLFMGHEWRLRYVNAQEFIDARPVKRVAVICERCGREIDLK